jgi:hypothetical protein
MGWGSKHKKYQWATARLWRFAVGRQRRNRRKNMRCRSWRMGLKLNGPAIITTLHINDSGLTCRDLLHLPPISPLPCGPSASQRDSSRRSIPFNPSHAQDRSPNLNTFVAVNTDTSSKSAQKNLIPSQAASKRSIQGSGLTRQSQPGRQDRRERHGALLQCTAVARARRPSTGACRASSKGARP